jgi:hypothetical protein
MPCNNYATNLWDEPLGLWIRSKYFYLPFGDARLYMCKIIRCDPYVPGARYSMS